MGKGAGRKRGAAGGGGHQKRGRPASSAGFEAEQDKEVPQNCGKCCKKLSLTQAQVNDFLLSKDSHLLCGACTAEHGDFHWMTVDQFCEEYNSNPAFATVVDEAIFQKKHPQDKSFTESTVVQFAGSGFRVEKEALMLTSAQVKQASGKTPQKLGCPEMTWPPEGSPASSSQTYYLATSCEMSCLKLVSFDEYAARHNQEQISSGACYTAAMGNWAQHHLNKETLKKCGLEGFEHSSLPVLGKLQRGATPQMPAPRCPAAEDRVPSSNASVAESAAPSIASDRRVWGAGLLRRADAFLHEKAGDGLMSSPTRSPPAGEGEAVEGAELPGLRLWSRLCLKEVV